MRRGPFGTGIFPWHGSGQRKDWGTVHTGILCPFCRYGELIVGHDPGATRWGVDGYYVTCSNAPRHGHVCRWVEGREHPQYIPQEEAEAFKIYKDNPETMVSMLRINVPDITPAMVLEEYKGEGLTFMYGPPGV